MMFKKTRYGDWTGSNKLWFDQPEAERSDGHIQVSESAIDYSWRFRGAKQNGAIKFYGPTTSFRAAWVDSWHSSERTNLHGCEEHSVIKMYGTYPDSNGGEWGWKIEIDVRDPEIFQLKMFNVEPNGTIHIAVDLRAKREAKQD